MQYVISRDRDSRPLTNFDGESMTQCVVSGSVTWRCGGVEVASMVSISIWEYPWGGGKLVFFPLRGERSYILYQEKENLLGII